VCADIAIGETDGRRSVSRRDHRKHFNKYAVNRARGYERDVKRIAKTGCRQTRLFNAKHSEYVFVVENDNYYKISFCGTDRSPARGDIRLCAAVNERGCACDI